MWQKEEMVRHCVRHIFYLEGTTKALLLFLLEEEK